MDLSLYQLVYTGSVTHPDSYPMCIGGSFPEGKAVGRGAHSPPSSAEVKNAWHYTSTPLIRLYDVVLS